MIGSFKTAMVGYFVERHAEIAETVAAAALAVVTTAGTGAGRSFQDLDMLSIHNLMSRRI